MGRLTAADIIGRLGLARHPEGGWYREIYRSPEQVVRAGDGATRCALTSIYFLLEAGDFSAWHVVGSDEVWQLIAGGPLELYGIGRLAGVEGFAAGEREGAWREVLSLEWEGRGDGYGDAGGVGGACGFEVGLGEWRSQLVIPAGVLQAACAAPGAEYALCTCLVAPGFDFADFRIPTRGELLERFPEEGELVERFSRTGGGRAEG